MKKQTLFAAVLIGMLVAALTLKAQNSVQELSYAAYLKSRITLWEKAISIQSQAVSRDGSSENKFELAKAYYGLLSATMATKDEDTFSKYLDKTKELLTEVIDAEDTWGEPSAVYSSVLGLEMAYSPMKGMYLGYKSSSYMSEAMEKSPDSPLVVKLFAGSKLYTPEMFGGDKDQARDHFIKSVEMFESNANGIDNNWFYMDALAHLGISYTQTVTRKKQKTFIAKLFLLNPTFIGLAKVFYHNC